MKRWCLGALVAIASVLACRGVQELVHEKVAPPTSQVAWTFDPKAWSVAKNACHQCHHTAPYPATFEMHASGTRLVGPSIQTFFDGIALEKAPANRRLSALEKDTLLRWAVSQGATWQTPVVPAAIKWSMDEQIAGAAEGSSAAAPGRFFGFRVEDLARLDPATFKIKSYTDRNGVTKKGVEFGEFTSINQDSFASSNNPVSYIFIDGLAYGTRMREFTIKGFCSHARWCFIGVHTKEMKKGPSPYDSRKQREYVRAQIDRDWVSVRGRKIPADGIETYPWGGPDPFLTAPAGEHLNEGQYQVDDEWLKFTFTGKDLGNTFRYAFLVEKVDGTDVAYVVGDRPDGTDVNGGFFLGGYGLNSSSSKRDRFAEVTIEATCVGASTAPIEASGLNLATARRS